MKNKIIFTQDIEGERSWLSNQFPDHINLETVFSGKWFNDQPQEGNNGYLYEISFRDYSWDTLFLDKNLPKIKSIYSNSSDDLFLSSWWAESDNFIHNLTFTNKEKSKNFIILNLARSGTMFAHSLISKKLIEFTPHVSTGVHGENIDLAETIKANNLTVFLTYRKNVWEWCTSNLIANKFGFYHHYSYRKENYTTMTANKEDLDALLKMQLATWNFWCNLKCYIPDLNCYLLEFDDIIKKYKDVTNHVAVPYVKNNIILNYKEIEKVFDNEYRSKFEKIVTNGSTHLKNMNCKTDLADLDLFAK